jgi:hypothetical protein
VRSRHLSLRRDPEDRPPWNPYSTGVWMVRLGLAIKGFITYRCRVTPGPCTCGVHVSYVMDGNAPRSKGHGP